LRLELSGNSIAQAFMSGIIGNIRSPGIHAWDYRGIPSLWHLRLGLSGESVAQAFMSVAQAFMPGIEMAGGKNKKNLPLFSEGRFSLKQ
jgi:hypothetical protein